VPPTVGTFRNTRSQALNHPHIESIYQRERKVAEITFRLDALVDGRFVAERRWLLADGSLEQVIDEILAFIGRDDVRITMHF